LAVLEALSDVLLDAPAMTRMMYPLPAVLLHLFDRRPRVVIPALVVPVSRPCLVGHPDELADIVGEFAKPAFALAQRRFAGCQHRLGARPFRYVLGDDVDADNGACGVFQ